MAATVNEEYVMLTKQDYQSMVSFMDTMSKWRESVVERWLTGGSGYLSRAQTMKFLSVSSTTLDNLRNTGRIAHSYATGRVQYELASCRDYLASKKVSKEAIEQRMNDVLLTKAKK